MQARGSGQNEGPQRFLKREESHGRGGDKSFTCNSPAMPGPARRLQMLRWVSLAICSASDADPLISLLGSDHRRVLVDGPVGDIVGLVAPAPRVSWRRR